MKISRLFLSNITSLMFLLLPATFSFAVENVQETQNLVKAGDKYVTLLGKQVQVGDKAPNFKVVNETFSPVSLKDFDKKTLLISVVPSLDTGICSMQTKRFNKEVAKFPSNVVMLTISNDLPFAQKRFCKIEKVDKIKVLSDAVWRDFGAKYGLLIKDMGLLTRSIFIIDEQGKVAYREIVANLSQHPNYEMALNTLKALNPIVPKKTKNISKNASEDKEKVVQKLSKPDAVEAGKSQLIITEKEKTDGNSKAEKTVDSTTNSTEVKTIESSAAPKKID